MEPQCMKGCRWCGAFMCPAMGWLDCGQRFHCPFCDKLTEGMIENRESKEEPIKKRKAGARTSSFLSVWMQITSPVQSLELYNPRIFFNLILKQLDKIFKISASFTCIFCIFCSSVPWQHYQPTNGVEGARVDKDKRPELSMGSYEILSSQKVKFT